MFCLPFSKCFLWALYPMDTIRYIQRIHESGVPLSQVNKSETENVSCIRLQLISFTCLFDHQDSKQVVESYKSGFEPPGDVEFEDYGQAMKRTASETSLSNSKETKEKPSGKGKGKLWPFIKNKNKVKHKCTHHVEHPTLAGFRLYLY